MSDDFAPFPLAVGLQNKDNLTMEIRHPDLKEMIPVWGNHCLWTDPPPSDCFSKQTSGISYKMNLHDFSDIDITNLRNGLGDTGKVSPDIDISTIPPHLRPLVKTISDFIEKNDIKLEQMKTSGITVIFHKQS